MLGNISEESSASGDVSGGQSRSRRNSQGSLKVPNSPTSSLSLSPQLTKKRRMAQSRRARNRVDSAEQQGGAGEGAGGGAEEQVSRIHRKLWNVKVMQVDRV